MRFCAILHRLAQNDDQYLTRRRQPTKFLGNGEKHFHPQTREGKMPHGESCRPIPLLSAPARGERRTGPQPPVSEEMARGLNECERRRGVIPRCTVAVTALS
ncbi:hypothetical protein TcCL_ESM07331 [Trypanosoma cruzi]|nr:hypothetical protein TcCL_ESM07331 [Trypanosoma cruzi]